MFRLIALLLMIATALPARADDRPQAGLMWNRSGLPATLPLVVRTMAGRDHAVFLSDAEGRDIMAGYIRGGDLFRLLVPPGTWRVRFAHGRTWQGEGKLFGPATEWTLIERPMAFGAGIARRHGHIIRLIESDGRMQVASIGPMDQCQALTVTTEVIDLDDERDTPNRLPAPALRRLEIDLETRSRVCG